MNYYEIPKFTKKSAYCVNISWSYLLKWIVDQEADYGLDLSPDYQRGHVWTDEQASLYVEYCLRGGISGREIYFNCASWGSSKDTTPMELVDGKQRIYAVLRFLCGEILAFGQKCDDFDDKNLMLRDMQFFVNINDLQTPVEVMQWYVDMNAGGTVHSEEEIKRVKQLISKEGVAQTFVAE